MRKTKQNNFDDESQLREKVAADIFRESGMASPRTQFYEVYVDHGEGPTYFGLYTMVEEPDDSLLKSQFSNDNGNLYKPDGAGARFTEGSFSTEYFIKQSNEMESNWSDVESVFEALHSSSRTSNPELWRSDLQEVFHVDGFLNYLAVNIALACSFRRIERSQIAEQSTAMIMGVVARLTHIQPKK